MARIRARASDRFKVNGAAHLIGLSFRHLLESASLRAVVPGSIPSLRIEPRLFCPRLTTGERLWGQIKCVCTFHGPRARMLPYDLNGCVAAGRYHDPPQLTA